MTRNNKFKTLSSSWMKEFLAKNVNVNGSKVFTVVFTRHLFENMKGSVQYSSLNFCGRAKTLVLHCSITDMSHGGGGLAGLILTH